MQEVFYTYVGTCPSVTRAVCCRGGLNVGCIGLCTVVGWLFWVKQAQLVPNPVGYETCLVHDCHLLVGGGLAHSTHGCIAQGALNWYQPTWWSHIPLLLTLVSEVLELVSATLCGGLLSDMASFKIWGFQELILPHRQMVLEPQR